MKHIKLLSLVALATMALAACDKTKVPSYEEAEVPTGEQVFFPKSMYNASVTMGMGDTSFAIPVWRANTDLEAVDVDVTASGEGTEYFTVPASVSFEEGKDTTSLIITVKDADALGQNNFKKLTLAVADTTITTPYGLKVININAGISLPYIYFADGQMVETWWGEVEPKTMYYQEISDTWRKCIVEDCFGYATIADGGSYDVQDYVWYWNVETNYCVVPLQYMGYKYNSTYPTAVSDAASFYYFYNSWADQIGAVGSEDYLNWAVAWMNAKGYQTPYYDGNGTFYLGSWYTLWTDTSFSEYFNAYAAEGDYDMFVGSGFTTYNISVSYDGMFVDPDLNAVPILQFASADDVTTIHYAITSQDVDADETEAAIVAGTVDTLYTVTLVDGAATEQPALEPGLYRLVAIPYVADDDEEPYKTKFTEVLDFYFPGMNAEAHDVEASLLLLSVARLYGQEAAESYGYYDYNSLAFYLKSSDVKAAKYLFAKAAAFEGATEDDLKELLDEYGYDFDDDDIAYIKEKGYYVGLYGGTNSPLDASTEYEIVISVTNSYGSSAIFTATATTGEDTSSSDGLARAASSKTFYIGEKSSINAKINGFRVDAGWGKQVKSTPKLIYFTPDYLSL